MKPNPPKPTWKPSSNGPTTTPQHDPIPSPLRIEDVSPFIDPLEPPQYGVSADNGDQILCDSCDRCWKMSVAGTFKNKKADGSDFLLTERFCVFKDSLVSLAERSVRECSRFVPKQKDSAK